MFNLYVNNKKKKKYSSLIITLVFLISIIYFSYHAMSGDRGVFALIRLSHKLDKSKQELDLLKAERLKLEHKVNSISNKSIDLDLLDEQSRRLLGYAGKNEIVILLDKSKLNN